MADERIIRIRLDGSGARTEAGKTNKAVQSVGVSADRAGDSLNRLSSVASAVITALATNQVLAYADSWTTVNNRLRQAAKTADEFNIAQRGVIEIAQRASVGIEGVATAYSRLAQATSELDLSQERLLDLTNKLTLALKAGGATADETSSVMIQLAQGLGSGALQGDELRSILEASIPITKALAKEFNVTTGELKTLGSEGKITADRVVNAIENMDESALTFTKTFSDGLTNVSNALTVYVGEIDESVGATKFLGESLQTIAQNIGLITDTVIALGVLFGARLAGAIASSTAAMIAYARGALTATVQTNALGQVVARSTALMNAQALAARGTSAAFALIGGPAGAAFLAAAAIVYFISQAESAEERSKRLAQEVENLKTKYLDLNEAQRRIEIAKLNTQFKELQAELVAANKRLNQFKGFAESPVKREGVRQYKAEVERLNIELDKVSQKQQAAFGAGIDQINFTDATNQSETAPTSSGSTTQQSSNLTERLTRENQLIQNSLLARQGIYQKYYQDANDLQKSDFERAQAQLLMDIELQKQTEQEAFTQRLQAISDRQLSIAENKSLTDQQKSEANALLREQAVLAQQEFENTLTQITEEGNARRQQLDQATLNARISAYSGFANSALSLISAFGSQSEKTQKKFAIAESIINITAGVAKALNNPYPANLGFAAQVAAQGAALVSTIKGTSSGSTATPSISAPSNSAAFSRSSAQASENQSQRRVIDLRGFESGGYLTKQQLTELLQSDDDVILASNSGQNQAQRTGLING